MKSGTSSLHSWLGMQPECWVPALKEPNFFSDDREWRRGLGWYSNLFSKAGDRLTGEASVRYTSPSVAAVAADRMTGIVPAARIIYVVRDPLLRLRSHYRHALSMRWTTSPLGQALDSNGEIVGRSLYYQCLSPYLERFPREQICVVRFEDLVAEPWSGWRAVLAHLGLSERPPPGTRHNVSSQIPEYPTWTSRLRRRGLLRPLKRWPRPVRELGKRVLALGLRNREEAYARIRAMSDEPIPPQVERIILEDVARLEAWLGVKEPLWPRGQ